MTTPTPDARRAAALLDSDPPPGAVVVLIGPAGSGKSTYATRRFPLTARINLDALRAAVADDPADMTATPAAVAAQQLLLEERLRRGLTTVLDSTNLRTDVRRALADAARRHDCPLTAVLFAVPLEVCLRQNTQRARRVPEDVIRAQYAQAPTADQLAEEGFTDVRVLVGAEFEEPLSLAQELHATADQLQELASAVEHDISTNAYWRSQIEPPARWYANGVRNGLGGAAGELAAAFDPATVRKVVTLLRDCATDCVTTGINPYVRDVARALLANASTTDSPAALRRAQLKKLDRAMSQDDPAAPARPGQDEPGEARATRETPEAQNDAQAGAQPCERHRNAPRIAGRCGACTIRPEPQTGAETLGDLFSRLAVMFSDDRCPGAEQPACPAQHRVHGRICAVTAPHDVHQGYTPAGTHVIWSGSAPDAP